MDNTRQSSKGTRRNEATADQRKIIAALKDLELVHVNLDEDGNAVSLNMIHHKLMTDKGIELAAKLTTLTSVTLWPMTDKRLAYLRQLPNLKYACFQNVSHGNNGEHITDAGMIPLSDLHGLEELYLSGAVISDAGLNHLKGLINLKKLQVKGSFTLEGLKQLSSISDLIYLEIPGSLGLGYAEFCPNLEAISDFRNNLSDSDLGYLQLLTKLKVFYCVSDKVSDSGIRHLMGIKSLRELWLYCPNVTEGVIKELREALPACNIEYDPCPIDWKQDRQSHLFYQRVKQLCVH